MTAGFAAQSPAGWPTLLSAGDAARDILRAADAPPGKRFQYSDDSAHLVSAILEQATGMPILDYARTRLFEPLGITTEPAFTPTVGRAVLDDDARVRLLLTEYARAGFAWWLDPQGHAMGWGSLKLRPRDLARLGRLYLDGGRRDGVQVVPAGWTREATVDQSAVPIWDSSGVGYGYGWWVRSAGGDRAYAATGYGGQLIEVVPALDLVVVTVADRDRLDATDQGVSTILMTSLAESVVAAAVRGNR
jgi:CubicO group peptidase (beta-lactamase class C family)